MTIPSQGRCSRCKHMFETLHSMGHNTKYCDSCYRSYKEEKNKYLAKWRSDKKDERSSYFRQYRAENKDRLSNYTSGRRKLKMSKLSKEELKEFRRKESAHAKEYTIKLKMEVIKQYGGKCVCCEETEPYFLAVDHIFDDGAQDRKVNGSGRRFYHYLKRQGFPKDRYQLLCYNCNNAKRILGVCPHQQGVTTIPGEGVEPSGSKQRGSLVQGS